MISSAGFVQDVRRNMTKEYCEFKTHVNGCFTIYRENGEYRLIIMSGFMKGEFIITKDELTKLKTFLKELR